MSQSYYHHISKIKYNILTEIDYYRLQGTMYIKASEYIQTYKTS